MYWIFAFLKILPFFGISSSQSVIRVQTKLGEVDGKIVQKDGQVVSQFLHLPYAQPPTGDLRFRKTVPVQNWTGVYSATSYGPSCMQVRPNLMKYFLPNLKMSEDCLSLNIYAPGRIDPSANKSVMIWIHGGGFVLGEAEMFDGSNLAVAGDVIVVTINYRLGVFGFLSSDGADAPGNFGLWDQLTAIKWVKENIIVFGGNPSSITIFGQSAGAVGTSMLLMSPASEGLFQRVICESGSSFKPNFLKTPGIDAFKRTGKILNCSISISETLKCFRTLPAETLLNITKDYVVEFKPVIDGEIIPDLPEHLMNDKSSKSYKLFISRDILFGINNEEGGLHLSEIIPKDMNIFYGIESDYFCRFIVPEVINTYFNGSQRVSKAVCEFYKSDSLEEQGRNAIRLLADVYLAVPMVKVLQLHRQTARTTYQYLFSQPKLMTRYPFPLWFKGAHHMDELGFVFGILDWNPTTETGDQALADLIMAYWTNFAKYGNPNGNPLQHTIPDGIPKWPSYSDNQSYMNLSRNPMVGNHLFQARMNFWLNIVPSLESPSINNYLNFIFG